MEPLLVAFLLVLASRRAWAGPMPINNDLIIERSPITKAPDLIRVRQASEQIVSTCGYVSGNLSNPWIAPNGFQCATDVSGGYFGFCGNDTAPSDCKPPRGCRDNHGCTSGCGDSTKVVQW
ncbi:hypothetical protein BDV96DRAFT_85887 [Lophiotrema nucula]|uniref:Uncharacterized protein n=1 Tax=Lophiotrema nucula TaxID=690887 RepID=A0A6A5Z662_9PLEO|nr:hypothetical protein BDV96DRAFT_85887 [Lophiotrema nucula]